MKKKLKIINTKSHGYVLVDDSEINAGDWYIDDINTVRQSFIETKDYWKSRSNYKKLIATSTEHKIEGVLQYVVKKQDELEDFINLISNEAISKQAENDKPIEYYKGKFVACQSILEKHKAAKELYPFSEEDLVKFADFINDNMNIEAGRHHWTDYGLSETERDEETGYYKSVPQKEYLTEELVKFYLKSLKQPTLPDVVSINVDEQDNPILTNDKIEIHI